MMKEVSRYTVVCESLNLVRRISSSVVLRSLKPLKPYRNFFIDFENSPVWKKLYVSTGCKRCKHFTRKYSVRKAWPSARIFTTANCCRSLSRSFVRSLNHNHSRRLPASRTGCRLKTNTVTGSFPR